jgi:hypothetical protein
VNRFRITGNQRVPPFQIPPVRQYSIGAGFGQPFYSLDIIRRQPDTVRHQLATVCVIGAPAGFYIEQITGYPGIKDAAGFPVFKLLQAAATASVTERFPLRRGQVMQWRGYPKGGIAKCHGGVPSVSVAAILENGISNCCKSVRFYANKNRPKQVTGSSRLRLYFRS